MPTAFEYKPEQASTMCTSLASICKYNFSCSAYVIVKDERLILASTNAHHVLLEVMALHHLLMFNFQDADCQLNVSILCIASVFIKAIVCEWHRRFFMSGEGAQDEREAEGATRR